jgi:hypothetical protein
MRESQREKPRVRARRKYEGHNKKKSGERK